MDFSNYNPERPTQAKVRFEWGTHKFSGVESEASHDLATTVCLYDFCVPLPELELIERVRRAVGARERGVVRGVGDDCAVLRGSAAEDLLVTTDLSIEGVHFRRDWHPAESVGWRCLVRGLSDVAAMGGEPVAAFLSLGVPAATPQRWVDGFMRGFLRLARKHGVPLAGGDTASSPRAIVADIVVVGRVPKGGAILRSGAKPGDQIYVTGEPGLAAAILARLRQGDELDAKAREFAQHFFPQPRIAAGRALREKKVATAMIDLSDGISSDLGHVCDESGVGAIVWQDELPDVPVTRRWRRFDRWVARTRVLHGGEDYELLFTAAAKTKVPARIAGVEVTRIGEIVPRRSQIYPMLLIGQDGGSEELKREGWEHFRSPRSRGKKG